MSLRTPHLLALSLLFLVASLREGAAQPGAPPAGTKPPEKAACFDAYPEAQRLRKQGKLRAAHAQLLICSQESCPGAVRSDCGQWLEEVSKAMPSVVIVARDTKGEETAAVRVLVDGEPLVEKLDGKAVALDPGEHLFRFEMAGKNQERKLLLREGEVRRVIEISFAPPPPPASASSAPPPSPPPPPATFSASATPPALTATPTLGYALGGLGILALAGSAYFYLDGRGIRHDLERDCAPACSPDQVDPLKRRDLFAGVSLGVGVASLGAAAYLLFRPAPAASETARVDLVTLPGGAFASYLGAF